MLTQMPRMPKRTFTCVKVSLLARSHRWFTWSCDAFLLLSVSVLAPQNCTKMSDYHNDRTSGSQKYAKKHSSLPVSSTKSRRNSELQHRQAAIRAKFGAEASQLKLTIYFILVVALALTGIALFSTNWLESERRYYGSKFRKLGLWRICFNSFSAPDDFQFKKFYVGCRWIFADEYKLIRKFLLPSPFESQWYLYHLHLTTNHRSAILTIFSPSSPLSYSFFHHYSSSLHCRFPTIGLGVRRHIGRTAMLHHRTWGLCVESIINSKPVVWGLVHISRDHICNIRKSWRLDARPWSQLLLVVVCRSSYRLISALDRCPIILHRDATHYKTRHEAT